MKRWAPLGAAVLLVGLTACGSGSSGTSGSAAGSSAKPAAGGDTASSAPAAGDSGGGAAGDCSKFTSPDPAKYPETPLDPRVLEVTGSGRELRFSALPRGAFVKLWTDLPVTAVTVDGRALALRTDKAALDAAGEGFTSGGGHFTWLALPAAEGAVTVTW